MTFNPANWFWLADDGRVFSSARQSVVGESDADFKAWLSAGFTPTRWPADASGEQSLTAMQDVLTPYGLFTSPAAALIAAATAASSVITKQIAATETQLTGYASAANMVQVAGGVPTKEPAKTSFTQLANAVGLSTDKFASLVLAMDAASVQNLAILATLSAATYKAKSSADLKVALTSYEEALADFVGQLNQAGLTGTITAPPAIVITGIND